MRQRIPQLSLLAKFSLLSLVAVGLMGAALAYVLKNQIRDRAAMDATRMATRIANDLVDQHVTRDDLRYGLTDEHLLSLEQRIDALVLRGTIHNAKLYSGSGDLVYSLDRSQIGQRDQEHVRPALRGEVLASFEEADGDGKPLYEIYVPLRLLGDRRPVGVFELYLPYRHRLLVAGAPARAAHPGAQDRSLDRARHGARRLGRGDRALDHRPGSPPRPRSGGGGRGERDHAAGAAPARLRRRAGLLPAAAPAGRRRERLAARARF
jgi:hypothetical protein